MLRKLSVFAFALLLISCGPKGNQKEEPVDENTLTEEMAASDIHTAEISLDYDGTYKGVLPCADCEGIETVLTLDYDGNYTLKNTYMGKDASVFETSGKFTWDEDGSTIILGGITDAPNRYFVGENRIFQLDMEGNRITGDLAEKYILEKE